ncbi:MAG: DNA repair protein RecO [Bacilli bacterium]|nr:DNA repair protein RecO [Mycoplasmatota bacterium]MDY4236421.1 DNA repair protein RecO [Bacilli bacterium]
MKIEKVIGIVLSDTNYSESSKILNVLTKEHGKIGIISKGCRNLKSSLRSVSSKLTYGYFNIYYKQEGLSVLISVDIINDFSNIKQDLFKIGYATFLSDLTNQVLKETSSNEIFDLFINGLIKINDDFDPMIITNIIELKYLNYLGVMPILDCCSVCGSNKKIVTVSSFSGGYLCVNCYKNEYIVDEKTVKLLRMFSYVDISKIKELNILPKNKNEINKFLENYYDRYTGIYLKSKDFLTQLREKY